MTEKNCDACKHCGMEPDDMNFICFHPQAGQFGTYVKHRRSFAFCVDYSAFEQHPLRNEDGTLKVIR